MIGVVVDVDGTLVSTRRRAWSAWCNVLGHEIPIETVESLGSRQILEKYGSSDPNLWRKFWAVLLCVDKVGIELLKLDEPVPFAANVLSKWIKQCVLIYLTGRPETIRDATLEELKNLGFPTDGTQLTMFSLKDWKSFSSVASLVETRSKVFSSICRQYDVVRVVDDDPRFFTIYRQSGVPDRIGLLRLKRFSPQDYLSQGATRVIESWKQLYDDPPRPIR